MRRSDSGVTVQDGLEGSEGKPRGGWVKLWQRVKSSADPMKTTSNKSISGSLGFSSPEKGGLYPLSWPQFATQNLVSLINLSRAMMSLLIQLAEVRVCRWRRRGA